MPLLVRDRNKILSIIIDDISTLRSAYMPFLKNRGLFISFTNNNQDNFNPIKGFSLDDQALLILQLLNEPEKIAVTARVVWITPNQNRDRQCQGVGFQFENNASVARTRIENLLNARVNTASIAQTL